jgi:hypothetical protein
VRILRWLGIAVAGAAVATVVAAGVTSTVGWIRHETHPPPPPVSEQLAGIFHRHAQTGFVVKAEATADLHGTGTDSRILIFGPDYFHPKISHPPRSDRIEIYDDIRGRLHLAFSYAPTARDPGYAPWTFGVELLAVRDVNGDREADVVASFNQEYADEYPPRPVVISWDPRVDRYLLRAVFGTPRSLTLVRSPHGLDGLQHVYELAVRVYDSDKPSIAFTSVAAETVVVLPSSSSLGPGPVLGALYVVGQRSHAEPLIVQLKFWSLGGPFGGGAPACYPGSKRLVLRLQHDETYEHVILRGWRLFAKPGSQYC